MTNFEASLIDQKLNFEDKRKLLFESLNSAATCIRGTSLDQQSVTDIEPSNRNISAGVPRNKRKQDKIVRRFQHKESIFKKPAAPISQCLKPRHVPDYKMNPHKWTKYCLDSVDTSDQSNTTAAFKFLKEIHDRKQSDSIGELNTEEIHSSRPKFNNLKRLENKLVNLNSDIETDDASRPTLKGSKVVMPEYVVGLKVIKKLEKNKIRSREPRTIKNTLKLDHLIDNYDNENSSD